MRALRRGLLVATICLAVSVFLSAGVSHAKSSTIKVEVEADLLPSGTPPPESGAKGKAKHETESIDGVVKKIAFEAGVKIPVPSTGMGITDATAAAGADIRLILSRLGADFAECRLAFDEIEADTSVCSAAVMAEYKVKVQIKRGVLLAEKGGCIDILFGSPVVPDAQAGDVATATLVVNPANRVLDVDFLQGTF